MNLIKIAVYLLAIIGVIACLFIAWMMVEDTIDEIQYKRMRKKERSAAIKIADKINDLHYYFIEDPKICNCLFLVQYYLKQDGHLNYDAIRAKVREMNTTLYCDLDKEKLDKWVSK